MSDPGSADPHIMQRVIGTSQQSTTQKFRTNRMNTTQVIRSVTGSLKVTHDPRDTLSFGDPLF
jgi:hypothetical protein